MQKKTAMNRIRIAVQKSGRLSEESLNLLKCCGIKVRPRKDQLFCHSDNFPLDLLLVRDDDIPGLVRDGICDFGIVGTNVLQETAKETDVEVVRYLDFGICRLSIAVPNDFAYESINSLQGRSIATSYPEMLRKFAEKNKIDIAITQLTGSVEIAPRLGIAEGICDLVSTGATLEANNLREVEVILESQAVLIKSPQTFSAEKSRTADIFQSRVEGAQHANGSKYIMLHAPKSALEKIVTLLPGAERPTVMELKGDNDKIAIHALCRESIFWETMEDLKQAGASSILVLPVEKMML
jgi:ATP phosphoribosyltransferase